MQATNVRAEERIIDLLKLELNKHSMACVAASPRAAITSMIEMMDELGTRVGLAEPAPAALYRAGAFYCKTPRGSKLTARFFLGRQQAIGVLAAGAQPLFWHTFDLPDRRRGDRDPGRELDPLDAGTAQPDHPADRHGHRPRPARADDHGRTPRRSASAPVPGLIRCAEPDYDPAAAALGVALANRWPTRPDTTWRAPSSRLSRSARSSPGASLSSTALLSGLFRCS